MALAAWHSGALFPIHGAAPSLPLGQPTEGEPSSNRHTTRWRGAACRVADLTRADDRDALAHECRDVSVQVNNAGMQVNGELLVDTAMTAGRGQGKIPPESVADAFWRGYLRDQPQIQVGKARAATLLARWAPAVAEKILRKG